jgi:DNA polymerase III gamma/tau subunit
LGSTGADLAVIFDFPVIGINEARQLRERAQLASENEEINVRAGAITEEAQNALLKTLEEPALGIRFIFHTPTSIQLLPTFLSRLLVSKVENVEGEENESEKIKKFLKADSEGRLKIVNDLIKKAGEEHKRAAIEFLDRLEKYIAENVEAEKIGEELAFALREIRQGRTYLYDKSGTPKLVLEHIALILP